MNSNIIELNEQELSVIKPGEALTITAVLAVLVASIVAVIVYRIFMSQKGNATIPGGFKFTWS